MTILKTTMANAKAAQSSKLRKLGAVGNLKLARHGEHAPRKYASGGAVDSPVEGMAAKPRLDRPGRKAGKSKGGDKKGGATVNVIIASGGGPKPPMGPPPDMPMPPPGAGPGGPPMPPPPMRKHGGKVMAP